MVLLVIVFLLLDGTVKVSYEPQATMDACHVSGQKFNTALKAMTDEDLKSLGVQSVTAWCDDKIILKITGKGDGITT